MIKYFSINNFKSIKKKYFPLKNLNLLLGLNGMGKSSFIQSLLLLKQSDKLNYGQLKLNGEYVKIGNTKDALYQYSKNEDLQFEICFDGVESQKFDFKYEMDTDILEMKNEVPSENFLKNSFFGHNFQYLSANRIVPTSIHQKSSSEIAQSNLGIYGEFTVHFIEVFGNTDVFFDNVIHSQSFTPDNTMNKNLVNKSLIKQINLWMGEISPGISLKITSIPNTENILLEYAFAQPNFGTTNSFKPINVGFGISYVLPVVTALLSAKPHEIIIIENPESHIHPRGQVELGKLIGLVANNNVQVIVETHSDHILNGIRVAVKEEMISSDKVVLFYFDKSLTESEQYSKITNIEIDKKGELSEYPKNMLDEWSNQMLNLLSQ